MFQNKKNKKDFSKSYKKEYDYQSLLSYSLFLLSKRDYSIKKMTEKLSSKTENEDFVNQVISKLIDNNYLSDERKAQSIIRTYSNKETGEKLKQRLKLAGINQQTIEDLKEDLTPEKQELEEKCKALFLSKFKSYHPDYYDKYVRFLLNKGFDYSIISIIIKEQKKLFDETNF